MERLIQVVKLSLLLVVVEWPVRAFLFLFAGKGTEYDLDGCPLIKESRPTWTGRLEEWEDRNPLAVGLISGVAFLVLLVSVWSTGTEDGLYHVGQSLKNAFWPWP